MSCTIALAVLIILVALLVGRSQLGSATVYEYERGLRFVRGNLRDELGPGLYRFLKAYTAIRKLDTRPVQAAVNSQEVLSKDGVAVKVSLSATYRIIDTRAAVLNSSDYATALYTELQQGLRAAVSTAEIEGLLANRADLGPAILQQCQPVAAKLGLALEAVAIRDLTLPGDLKKMFAQVVKARQEGLASLERARGETAALRSLANAAQMVQRNPALLQLRLLQTVAQQPSSTFVIGMPPGTTPLPVAGPSDGPALPPGDVAASE